jgi:hypothetical protein
VRDKTTQVQTSIASLGSIEHLADNIVLVQVALLDLLINAHDILPDNTTSTDIEMANLRVAHKTFWQTNSQGGSLKLGESIRVLVEFVHNWGVRIGDGISILRRVLARDAPSVNHDCNAKAQRLAM